MRSQEEIYKQIRMIQSGYKSISHHTPEVREDMKDGLLGQLCALYWVLGHSPNDALDMALLALDEDPIDRS